LAKISNPRFHNAFLQREGSKAKPYQVRQVRHAKKKRPAFSAERVCSAQRLR
jgi:hypothetical protein